jgi:tRNA dimethylallyltransferase
MTGNAPILVILGPTGSGKSALAHEVAGQYRGEILTVDSMQIYREMDIGTAKPSAAQRAEIPHHLLDQAGPDEIFSAARFVALADQTIAAARQRGVPLIATGGTPLYYKALFQGLFEGPSSDETVRDRLRSLEGAELHAQLMRVDPAAAARIHVSDQRRLIRAIEVHELTGQPISSLQKQWESNHPARHPAMWIGLAWERDALNRRINARVKEMVAAGWVDEVRNLLKTYAALSKTAAEATGYKELIDHVQGRVSLEDAMEQIKIATRQLARRQMKWFKRFGDVHWLPGDRPPAENAMEIQKIWNPTRS